MRMAALASLLLLTAGSSDAKGRRPGPPAVFAAASLRDVLTDISKAFEGRSGEPPRLVFEASSTLAKQIQEGAPADIFITATPEWLDRVPVLERFDWLANRLVLVLPKGTPAPALDELESLALAGPEVPAGKYAAAALQSLHVQLPARIVYGSSVRDVLSKVSEGGAQAGIVYSTDVHVAPELYAAYTFPADSHPKILYSAGLLAEPGRPFFEALRRHWAQDLAKKRGFSLP